VDPPAEYTCQDIYVHVYSPTHLGKNVYVHICSYACDRIYIYYFTDATSNSTVLFSSFFNSAHTGCSSKMHYSTYSASSPIAISNSAEYPGICSFSLSSISGTVAFLITDFVFAST
jgi:hypothetical protein